MKRRSILYFNRQKVVFLPLAVCIFRITFLVVSMLLTLNNLGFGQTAGMIIKPAAAPGNAVLDPDGDGYVSQKTNGIQLGFTIPPDNDVFQSELPYVAIIRPDPLSDLLRGPTGSFSEIVGVDAAGNNAILTYNDGTNFLIRFRLGGYAPNSKSYSLLLDTDGKFGFTGPNADPNAITGNPGFETEIVLETNFNVKAFNVNGTTTGSLVASYPYETNCQKSMAVSAAEGDPDYFYDFYLPFSSITSLFTASTPLRIVAVTVMNPNGAMGNNALSDVGGVTSGSNVDAIFEELIDEQTPTVPGEEVLDRSVCPTINPITISSTTISGTSTEASGTAINVYVYQSNGTTTVGSGSTTTSGSTWTINVSALTPSVTLAAGYIIKATATATGKGVSYNNCDIETVAAECLSPPAAPSSLTTSSKGICGTIASGATLNIYLNGVLIHSTSTSIVGTLQITGTSFSYKPNGSFSNCNSGSANMASGFYEVSQTVAGCESAKVSYSLTCTGNSAIPVITNPIYAGTVTISGTSGLTAAIELFIDGVSSGTTTASGGAWSFASKTVTAGQIVKVIATEAATCLAGTSNLITVTAVPAPVITTSLCGTITTVSGYINATSGTVQIYVVGAPDVAQGSAVAIQSNGAWSVTGISIASGTIYAKATLNGGITSVSSSIVIGSKTSNAVAITDGTILEGATSISGTGTTGDLIKLYIGGAYAEYSTTVASGSWTITSIPAYEFFIGAEVYVTATASGQCEGDPSALKTVQCVVPASPIYSGGSFNYCYGSTGSISLTSSQSGVVYQLVNSSGTAVGPASIGTGSGITLYTNALVADLSTIYVKAYKIGYSSCSTTATTVINFTPQLASPSVTFSSTSLSVQQGTTSVNLSFTAKSANPQPDADTYTIDYSVAANNQGFNDITSPTAIPSAPGSIALTVPSSPALGTYAGTITVRETAGSSCSSSYGFTITVYGATSPPIISVHPASATICSGTTTGLAVTASGPPTLSYQWQTSATYSGTYSPVGSNSPSYTTASLTSTTYYRVVVSNSNGSTTSNVATVTVTALPVAAGSISGNATVCAGQTAISYSVPTITNATSYTWNYITGTGATITGTTNSVSLNFALSATSGSLTVAGTNGCGNGASNSLSITVNPTPSISAMTVNSCSGAAFSVTPVNVTNGIVPSGITYTWGVPVVTGGLTGGVAGSGSAIGGTLVNTSGSTQTATYTVTPATTNCTGSTFTVTVSVNPKINLTATPVATICNTGSTGIVNLTITGGTPGFGYAWTGPSFTATTQNLSGLAAGTYSLTVTDSKTCTATTCDS